jgi:hypothetical protein
MLDNLMLDKRLLPEVREVIKRLESTLLISAQSDPRFSLSASILHDGFPRFLQSISDAVSDIASAHAEPNPFCFRPPRS